MRTQYKNGDRIHLQSNGCDNCNIVRVNGILCHEQGCPDSWRDYKLDCFQCGCDFMRTERYQTVCEDCSEEN